MNRTTPKISVRLGETDVEIGTTTVQGKLRHRFLVIHDDENTAAEAVRDHIARHGGTLIELDSRGERNVTFTTIAGDEVFFDPNRMFSDAGLKENLKKWNAGKGYGTDPAVYAEIHKLRDAILAEVLGYDPVIATHNNSDERFGIRKYERGESEEVDGNTRDVPGNPITHAAEDADNFFLVTRLEDFDRIKGKYNVVLQSLYNDSTRGTGPREDGSLSVTCKDRRYFNVEAQDGSRDKQVQILEDLEKVIAGQTLK